MMIPLNKPLKTSYFTCLDEYSN